MPSSNFEQNRQRLIEAFYERFIEGGSFATITQARQLAAGILDEAVRPGEPLTKAVEEAIEQGMLLAAKHIVETGEERTDDIYDRLVDLYHRQPTLGTRTSSSIELQQYSTPAPLAYLAGKLAGIDPSKTVYEPTAGRGALLMLSTPANVLSNELDPKRAADLLSQVYRTTNHDATRYRPEQQVDVVISNPPFGRRKGENGTDKFLIGAADTPITTAELDQAISWKALEAMKDNGTAVLIIGSERGNDEERQKRYNSLRVRKYFFNLYRQYHVIEHFTVEGSLYNRQGGGYPVDIIAIEGRKQQPFLDPKKDIRKLPGADPPRIYSSYEQLKEILPRNPMNLELISYLERPLYIPNPRAWEPEEHDYQYLFAILVPPEMKEIQNLEQYQELLELRLKAMVQEYEPGQSQTWQQMVRSRCSALTNAALFLPATMNDDEIIHAMAHSALVSMKLGEVATFPQTLPPEASEAENGAISIAGETSLEEWLIELTL